MVPRTLAALALLAVLTALAGCSGDPEPKLAPTPSPSVSSPVPPPSVTPVAETPEAFIKRWAAASREMQNTGVVESFAKLNDPGCVPCNKLVTIVSGYYAAGGSVEADPWMFTSIKASGTDFEVKVVTKPTRVVPKDQAPVTTTDGGAVTFLMTLKSTDLGWLMADFAQKAT